jgi:hypothetical protein
VLELIGERIAAGEPGIKPPPETAPKGENNYEIEIRLLSTAGRASLPALRIMLRARDAGVRKLAVGMIAKLSDTPEVVDDLIARAQDRDKEVQLASIKALDSMGPAAVKATLCRKSARRTSRSGAPRTWPC